MRVAAWLNRIYKAPNVLIRWRLSVDDGIDVFRIWDD
jgi:hypothetical protein